MLPTEMFVLVGFLFCLLVLLMLRSGLLVSGLPVLMLLGCLFSWVCGNVVVYCSYLVDLISAIFGLFC